MTTPSEPVEIYCLKCKARTGSKDIEIVTMKNGRPASRSVCVECGTKKFRLAGWAVFWQGFAVVHGDGIPMPSSLFGSGAGVKMRGLCTMNLLQPRFVVQCLGRVPFTCSEGLL